MKLKMVGKPRTAEEAFSDPLSIHYGRGVRSLAPEPGLNLRTPVGLFRSEPAFVAARNSLINNFEFSKKLAGSGQPDGLIRSIRMMGPVFTQFVDLASQLPYFELAFIEPEVQMMADFFRLHTGASAEDALGVVQAHIYQVLEVLPEGVTPAEHVKTSGQAFGLLMSDNAELAIEEAAREREFLRDKEREARELRKIKFDRLRPKIEAAREARRLQREASGFGGGAAAAAPQAQSTASASWQQPERKISSFRGPYMFLSNMSDSPLTIDGITYPRVENAFHAMKTDIPEERARLVNLSGFDARNVGRRVTLAGGKEWWDQHRVPVMLELLRLKFSDPVLRQKLIATGDAYLEEGPPANDVFWGVVNGRGENMLGKLLMQVRDEARSTPSRSAPAPQPRSGRVLSVKMYSVAMLRAEPQTLFVFGDNLQGWGKKGQAIIRDEPNAVGIPTKRKPATTEDAYFTDGDMVAVKPIIDAAVAKLRNHLSRGGDVVLPEDGIGTGLAQLPARAPRIYNYIVEQLRSLT